jgi:hypothetical protein
VLDIAGYLCSVHGYGTLDWCDCPDEYVVRLYATFPEDWKWRRDEEDTLS